MAWIWHALAHDNGEMRAPRALAFWLSHFACLSIATMARARWYDLHWRSGHWYLGRSDARNAHHEVLLLPPVVHALGQVRVEFAAQDQAPGANDLTALRACQAHLLPLNAGATPFQLRKVLALAAEAARRGGDEVAAERLSAHRLPALRYGLWHHAPTPRGQQVAHIAIGARAKRGENANAAPGYMGLSDDVAQETVRLLRPLWQPGLGSFIDSVQDG